MHRPRVTIAQPNASEAAGGMVSRFAYILSDYIAPKPSEKQKPEDIMQNKHYGE